MQKMSRWAHLWTQLRFRGINGFAQTFKLRTQGFVHRFYDNSTITRWVRAQRRAQYARALACVRSALDTPRRRALMLSATGVYKSRRSEQCNGEDYITDQELIELVDELEQTKELARKTLYCPRCSLRLIIDTRHPGVKYCDCKHNKSGVSESHEGWTAYMETLDVVIWRKELREGTGLYMYKVYGRYSDVSAADFASVQVDAGYRRAWDSAVAALSTVERCHYGDADQHVIHWEVVWPRLFANRDYVYVRRYKEFASHNTYIRQQRAGEPVLCEVNARPSGEKQQQADPAALTRLESQAEGTPSSDESERLVVIVSKACDHPRRPVSKNAIRVTQYWSHMVIRSLQGYHDEGMEFVLTYYDQPAVGGMPRGVAAWATGRAAPEYLARMRTAAQGYAQWQAEHITQEENDEGAIAEEIKTNGGSVREEDMESSRQGPIIDLAPGGEDAGAAERPASAAAPVAPPAGGPLQEKEASEEDTDDPRGWWRYLHPFYFA